MRYVLIRIDDIPALATIAADDITVSSELRRSGSYIGNFERTGKGNVRRSTYAKVDKQLDLTADQNGRSYA